MTENVDSSETRLKLQGDTVLVYQNKNQWLMTFVHVVDVGRHQLRLVNRRDKKTHKPDWPVSQLLLNAVKPAGPNKENAKWMLHVK